MGPSRSIPNFWHQIPVRGVFVGDELEGVGVDGDAYGDIGDGFVHGVDAFDEVGCVKFSVEFDAFIGDGCFVDGFVVIAVGAGHSQNVFFEEDGDDFEFIGCGNGCALQCAEEGGAGEGEGMFGVTGDEGSVIWEGAFLEVCGEVDVGEVKFCDVGGEGDEDVVGGLGEHALELDGGLIGDDEGLAGDVIGDMFEGVAGEGEAFRVACA